ncbi:chondroitin sulfate synthase 3-like [Branchiostoma lanceolatum]|uniref:chondroitin sulfate synthase 3-like n=1 Tax=Branchiostoma lanceolatum TaxID=7740 RepID=UPI003454164A
MAAGKLTSFLVGLLVGVTISVTLLIIGSPHLLSNIVLYNNSVKEPNSQPTVNNNNNKGLPITQPRTLARDSFLIDRSLKGDSTDTPQNKYQGDAPIQVKDIPNFVSQELDLRRTVFAGVLTSWEVPSSTQQMGVMKTWGAEMEEGTMTFYAGMEESIEEDESVPVQRVTGTTMGQKMYSALRHMCHVHLDKFKFFLLTVDNTYVHVNNLTLLLDGLQSSEVIYMGSSKRGPRDPTPVQYCELGPGVVLSRKAMQGLCTHVTSCAKPSANQDPAYSLALCLQMTTATNCTTSGESKSLFHKLWVSEDLDGDLDQKKFVTSSVTLHPVGRLETMFRLHQSYLGRRILDKLQNHKDLADRIHHLNRLIASTGPHGDVKLLLGDQENSRSSDVVPWQLIYEDSEEEDFANVLRSLDDVVQLSVEALRTEAMIEPKLKALFQRYHPVTGINYRLEYEESEDDSVASHFVDVQKPYGNLYTVSATVGHKERVNFIVPVLENSQHLEEFLQMFESSCLTVSGENEVALILVNFGVTKQGNRLHQLLSPYEKKYVDFSFKVINVKSESFSYARGIEIGLQAVSDPDSLLCVLDTHATISPDFMNKCRLNTQRGRQAYFPIPYQQFDLSATKAFSLAEEDIAPGIGFWWERNFDTFCVYKSDVQNVEDLQLSGKNLSDKLTVRKSFSVFRVPEQGLLLPQRDRHCSSKFMTFDQTDICLQKQKEILTMQRHFSNLTER